MGRIVARQTCARTEIHFGAHQNKAKAPKSLRFEVAINSVGSKRGRNPGRKISMAASLRAALFSVSYATLGIMAATETWAQTTTANKAGRVGPSACSDHRSRSAASANTAPAQRADRAGPRRRSQVARRPEAPVAPKPFAESQDARTAPSASTPTAPRSRPRPTHRW